MVFLLFLGFFSSNKVLVNEKHTTHRPNKSAVVLKPTYVEGKCAGIFSLIAKTLSRPPSSLGNYEECLWAFLTELFQIIQMRIKRLRSFKKCILASWELWNTFPTVNILPWYFKLFFFSVVPMCFWPYSLECHLFINNKLRDR